MPAALSRTRTSLETRCQFLLREGVLLKARFDVFEKHSGIKSRKPILTVSATIPFQLRFGSILSFYNMFLMSYVIDLLPLSRGLINCGSIVLGDPTNSLGHLFPYATDSYSVG